MTIAFVLSTVYFYLPGGLANIGAVVAKFVPFFREIKTPVDMGISFRGRRLIGDHKTIGNALFGVILGTFTGVIKYLYFDNFLTDFLLLRLSFWQNLAMSLLMSFGAVSGDLIKSIVKRQIGISAHKAWIPFDEIDHTTMSMLLVKVFFGISWQIVIVTILIVSLLHFISNFVGYVLKIKKVPY